MSRLVSCLLIFSLLLVQSLPHSHAGSGVAQSDDHGCRPHIHLTPHSHATHAHSHSHGEHEGQTHSHHDSGDSSQQHPEDDASGLSSVHGHDDDALYFVGSTLSLHRLNGIDVPTASVSLNGSMPERFCLEGTSESEAFRPPLRRGPLPIYLLVASLRL